MFDKDSQYQRVVVEKTSPNTRTMKLDKLAHSYVNLADPLDMQYEYEAIYAEVMKRCQTGNKPLTAMMIGGGGYVFPRYLEITYPGSYIEVSELDPVVTQAAIEAFGLPKDSPIHSYPMDGRNRVADLIRQKRAGDFCSGLRFHIRRCVQRLFSAVSSDNVRIQQLPGRAYE